MPLHRLTAQEMADYKFFPKKNYCYKEISNSFVQNLNGPPHKQIIVNNVSWIRLATWHSISVFVTQVLATITFLIFVYVLYK